MLCLWRICVASVLLFHASLAIAQEAQPCLSPATSSGAPRLCKIDPPNWWSPMPAPMLLVYGEGLADAHFRLSDRTLHIDQVKPSSNGHYAQLWLHATAMHPETVHLTATNSRGSATIDYTFQPRRAASDGFAGFSSSDVMYLIMPDRFADGDPSNDGPHHDAERARPRGWHGGDLRGILDHLDYLQQLGITTLWITPIEENHEPDSYHGYGATDLYRVDEHFGTLADLQELSSGLHKRHMKLVLDRVPNHVGPAHPWATDSPDPTWFHGTVADHTQAQGEFAPATDPHAPWRDQRRILRGWFANLLPDLNQEDPAVERYLIQNTAWWVEQAGVDGLRLDTFPYVGRAFWQHFHAELHTLYPHLTTVGEVFNGDATITSTYAGGVTRTGIDTGLDTPFDYPDHFALHDVFLEDAPMTRLTGTLRLDNLFPHPERLVPFLDNHDVPRFMSDPNATLPRLELAMTVLTTMRGMPQLYVGDELAMRGGGDPDNRHDFPGGFPGDSHNAFTAAGRTAEEQTAFTSLQHLLALRRTHAALQTGSMQVLEATHDVLVYVRVLNQPQSTQRILVAINKGKTAQTLPVFLTDTALAGTTHATMLLSPEQTPTASIAMMPQQLVLQLGPESAIIAQLD